MPKAEWAYPEATRKRGIIVLVKTNKLVKNIKNERIYIFIAPYSSKGGIGLVTVKVFITTTNYIKYERKQQNYSAYTISIIIIL